MSRITQSANGKACVRCGKADGTVCSRHYNGFRSHVFGKGRSQKCHDMASADLCHACDQLFSEGVNPMGDGMRASKSIDRSEQFLTYVVLTNIRRADEGVV